MSEALYIEIKEEYGDHLSHSDAISIAVQEGRIKETR